MLEFPKSEQKLKSVGLRLHLKNWARLTFLMTLLAAAFYGIALLTSRFTGYGGEYFTPNSLWLIPAFGVLVGSLFYKKPSRTDAARVTDQYLNSNDLYLTVTGLELSFGEYRPLVVKNAEANSDKILPAEVVPFVFGKELGQMALAAVVLIGTLFYLPQFDPFGEVQANEELKSRKKLLAAEKKATQERKEQLKKKEAPEQRRSEDVKKALSELKKTFKDLKPREKEGNQKKLASVQKSLGKMWKNVNSEQLQKMMHKKLSGQRFGSMDRKLAEEWTKELQEGSTKSMEKAMDAAMEKMKQLARATSPKERSKLKNQLLKDLKQLKEFAEKEASSQELASALKRAMKQLEMAEMASEQGDSSEAEEGYESARESMELSKMELQEMKQAMEDLQELEEALQTLQMAKKENAKAGMTEEQLEMLSAAESLAAYAEMYAQMMGDGMGEGEGEGGEGEGGTGGEGFGEGGQVAEDPDAKTKFKTEFSKSSLTAGKVLLSMSSKDVNESGEMKRDFSSLMSNIKQGMSEAILQEQIPAGYHDSIKNYFDTLEENSVETPGTSPSENKTPVEQEK